MHYVAICARKNIFTVCSTLSILASFSLPLLWIYLLFQLFAECYNFCIWRYMFMSFYLFHTHSVHVLYIYLFLSPPNMCKNTFFLIHQQHYSSVEIIRFGKIETHSSAFRFSLVKNVYFPSNHLPDWTFKTMHANWPTAYQIYWNDFFFEKVSVFVPVTSHPTQMNSRLFMSICGFIITWWTNFQCKINVLSCSKTFEQYCKCMRLRLCYKTNFPYIWRIYICVCVCFKYSRNYAKLIDIYQTSFSVY